MKNDDLYIYSATVDRVVDGDSVYLIIDLGFGVTFRDDLPQRLARINAPEKNRKVSKEAGLAAKAHLETLLKMGPIIVQTKKPPGRSTGKYGRYLVDIMVEIDEEYWNVNDQMVEDGHAIYQEY